MYEKADRESKAFGTGLYVDGFPFNHKAAVLGLREI